MGKNKGINQTCSHCFDQVSTVKNCNCSPDFKTKKGKKTVVRGPGESIRRTERIKREKPDYFDILQYERQARREKKQRAKARAELNKQVKSVKTEVMEDNEFKSNRMHLDTIKSKKIEAEVEPPKREEDLEEIILSKETLAKFDLILQEINRKIYASSWRIYT